MTTTLLSDVKVDRLSFDLPDLDAGEVHSPVTTVDRIGTPEVEETRMCAKCIGECKVF